MSEPNGIPIRALDSDALERRLPELAALLVDAVAHGASVNFMAGFSRDEGVAFWRGVHRGVVSGGTTLLAADEGARLVGTVLLAAAPQPNGPHRAEIGKMLVASTHRRRGLGRRLLAAAEDAALASGRTLLLLDTETGSAGDLLYRRCGWIECGRVPGHSYAPDGRLAEATMFMKTLGPHRAAAGQGR